MKGICGLSLKRLLSQERISALFVTEARIHLYSLAMIILAMECGFMVVDVPAENGRGIFVAASFLCFFGYFVLECTIRKFTSLKLVSVLSVLPGLILFALLVTNGYVYIASAVLLSVIIRFVFSYTPCKGWVLRILCFLLDAFTVVLWARFGLFSGQAATDKLLVIVLVILTMSSFQHIFHEKCNGAFPFHYFILLGALLLVIPLKSSPIDWSFMERLVVRLEDVSYGTGYFFDELFHSKSYLAGYSSLDVTGGRLHRSEKPQLILTTSEKPYFVYTDEETGIRKKMRRTLYLSGGKGIDKEKLISFLQFLHNQGVTNEQSEAFSQISKLEVEYSYLNTPDEIAPTGSIILYADGQPVTSGVAEDYHKKGYELKVYYLDIDYGNSYLRYLMGGVSSDAYYKPMSYEEAKDYMDSLYDIDLSVILSEKEYASYVTGSDFRDYLETDGDDKGLKELSAELIADATSEYDKCKRIEYYLRQYTYSTEGTSVADGDILATTSGMENIADSFLFETKEGYCVHFTAAMVSLLRYAGIPARIERGYRYSFPFEQQDSYVVTANQAHVWPEAYIAGVGWVPFEPTSAYYTADENSWHRGITGKSIGKSYYEESQNLNIVLPDSDEGDSMDSSNENRMGVLRIAGIMLGSIAGLILLIIVVTFSIKRIRYKYATPAQRLQIDVETIKANLIKRNSGGVEFSDRGLLSDYVSISPEFLKADVQKAFDLYYRMKYGSPDDGISFDESVYVKGVRESLEKYYKRA